MYISWTSWDETWRGKCPELLGVGPWHSTCSSRGGERGTDDLKSQLGGEYSRLVEAAQVYKPFKERN